MTLKILMNINEVHWNFSDNGTKEPAKTLFWNICNFWTVWNFFMQFSPLCSGEWALSFYTWVIIYSGVSLNLNNVVLPLPYCSFRSSLILLGLQCLTRQGNRRDSSRGRASASCAVGQDWCRINTWPRHTKDVIKWYQWLPCLALSSIRQALASLLSQTMHH